MKKILLIDNYDSFTYNLYHLINKVSKVNIRVVKNDEKNLKNEIIKNDFIVISPGPGIPKEAGKIASFLPLILQKENVLGICLGHQILGEYFGAKLFNLKIPLHGVSSNNIVIKEVPIFYGLPKTFKVARYHSWSVDFKETICNVTSIDENNLSLSFKLQHKNIYGLQFHPESILSEYGHKIIFNWINK